MRKLSIIFLSVFPTVLFAQNNPITLCHTAASEKFALFASNKEFNAEHPSPRKYKHLSQVGGESIKFTCPDGSSASGYLLKAKNKSANWVFVFQEWWGLNDNIKRQSEDLYKSLGNVNVLAIDMYDGKVATDRETAGSYMKLFEQERGNMIVKGALTLAGKNAKISTIGWCFGGGQSLQAALTIGKQAVACVMYYGMPEENTDRLKTLYADVLFIFAEQDQWINNKVLEKFESNAKAADINLSVKKYNARHGFANPSNPMGAFDEAAYNDAYENTVSFLKKKN